MKKPILLINQSIGPLFLDVIKSSRKQYKRVDVFKGISYKRSNYIFRLLTWSIFSIQLFFYLAFRRNKYEKVLVVSNPPFAPFILFLTGCRYSLLLYDLYPQILNQIKHQNIFLKVFIKGWHYINKKIYNSSEHIFTLSENMANQLKISFDSKYKWQSKVKVVPPWTNTNFFKKKLNNPYKFRLENGISKDTFLLTYAGNFGITHPLEIIVDASKAISKNIKILMIGSGAKSKSLKLKAKKLEIPTSSLSFMDPLSFERFPACISAADISIVAIDGPSAEASLPSKTFTSLACGKPLIVIAPLKSDLARLVEKYECGFVIEIGKHSAKVLANKINYLASNKKILKRLTKNAFKTSLLYTDKNADILVNKWLSNNY